MNKKTATLQSFEWKALTCPLERVKVFRAGYSIKCPERTEIGWIPADRKDHCIKQNLLRKRSGATCTLCMSRMLVFLEKVSGRHLK